MFTHPTCEIYQHTASYEGFATLLVVLPHIPLSLYVAPWNWALIDRPPVVRLLNFPAFYGTQRCIIILKEPPPAPILSQINSVHTNQTHLAKFHFNTIHPHMSWSSYWFFLSCFPANILHAFLFSPIRACIPILLQYLTNAKYLTSNWSSWNACWFHVLQCSD
jgi:hypothetical protein